MSLLDILLFKSDECHYWQEVAMIKLGKKYKLKKIKGFISSDNEYYKVIGFYNFDTVIVKTLAEKGLYL